MATIILKTPEEVANYIVNDLSDNVKAQDEIKVAISELKQFSNYRTYIDGNQVTFYIEPPTD
jgi:hypothetical protein